MVGARMVGARTEAGPTGAVRMAVEADTRMRVVRMGAAGRIVRAEAEGDILARDGRAVAGTCWVGEAAGAGVDLEGGDRRVRRRWRGRAAGDRATAAEDMAAGTAVLRGRLADIRPGLKAVELTGDLATVTAEATVVVTLATVGLAMRTADTAAPVDLLTTTSGTRADTTATLVGHEVAVDTATRTEIRAMVAVVMGRLQIAAMLG
jgi:hypothetical protein